MAQSESEEVRIVTFDKDRFYLRQGIGLIHTPEIITFLNERGDELLLSGPISERDIRWRYYWSDSDRMRVVTIRCSDNDLLVAVAAMNIRYTWRRGIGTIEYVLADKDFRGRGLGRAVVSEFIQQAQESVEPPLDKLELVSEPHHVAARALYESLGFRLVKGSDRHYELFLSKNDEHPDAA